MNLFYQSNVPANQNLLYKTTEDAKNATVGELDIRLDEANGFIYNHAFDPDKVNYSGEYDNNQNWSPYFAAYIDRQIDYLVSKYIPEDSVIVEVGCGKGYYVEKLVRKLSNCTAYGFDTSYVYEEGEPLLNNLQYFKEYYDGKYAYLRPDVVICRHVIEHIHNPLEFLKEIRATMPEHALLFIETPDVNWILKNTAIFDFFYEHCSYWNEKSIEYVLRLSGFEIIESKCEFGGQYMWIVSRAVSSAPMPAVHDNHLSYMKNLCCKFANDRVCEINSVMHSLYLLKQKGTAVFVWGAGAKGTTFVNLFDEHKQFVSALIDISPAKQNKFVGKTSHKVLESIFLINMLISNNTEGGVILVLNENYVSEVNSLLIELDLKCVAYSYPEFKSIEKIL
ncbi:MAG: methyltransferase domain-containing protein [Prevotellaceae bacterium]|jgi:SAM-dependent methyltransferase|nr:methyltransferase domain-containing protein [Prevotellaceae bacterium]